jgi:hypothetical protein
MLRQDRRGIAAWRRADRRSKTPADDLVVAHYDLHYDLPTTGRAIEL